MNQKGVLGLEVLIWMIVGITVWLGALGIEGHLHGHQNCICVGKLEMEDYREIKIALGE